MNQRENSVEDSLKTIRDLMQSSQNFLNEEVLELTEDDLVDELDEDAYEIYLNDKKNKNDTNINEILTQNSYSANITSADDAVKSIETLKSLIKKAEQPIKKHQLNKSTMLEEAISEALKPLLQDWINKNLLTMVQEIIEKEVRNLTPKK